MPQFSLEYTDNIKSDADIAGPLRKVNDTIIAQPTRGDSSRSGIQSRAIELQDYRMADAPTTMRSSTRR
jgi:5-carboxymethyl-2-hydroxymuconate isomerase